MERLTREELVRRIQETSRTVGGPGSDYWWGYLDALDGSNATNFYTDPVPESEYLMGKEDYHGDMELWDAIEED